MSVVEDVMVLGSDHPLRSIVRDEHLLLSPPHAPKVPVKLWGEHAPLTVVHYPQQYEPGPGPPPFPECGWPATSQTRRRR